MSSSKITAFVQSEKPNMEFYILKLLFVYKGYEKNEHRSINETQPTVITV